MVGASSGLVLEVSARIKIALWNYGPESMISFTCVVICDRVKFQQRMAMTSAPGRTFL